MERDEELLNLLYEEINKAKESKSEFLEIDFDLEFENENPKVYAITEDKNWATKTFFLKVINKKLLYLISTADSLPLEILNEEFYPEFEFSLLVSSNKNVDELVNQLKIKPSTKQDFKAENIFSSFMGFDFNIEPNSLENQIFKICDILDSDKENFQKLFNKTFAILTIGIPQNSKTNSFKFLGFIKKGLIRRLAEYNLDVQLGEILEK